MYVKRCFEQVLDLSPGELSRLKGAVADLHAWYGSAARTLPWRRTRDPYAIWVSEVMLQQTRVTTVVPYYERWMALFPDLGALASADEHDVLNAWEGLGYYSRARNLHRAAQIVVQRFGGVIPSDPGGFRSLPGVGSYTTAAVLSIAFGLDLAVVDGNVRRVLARLVAAKSDLTAGPQASALESLAQALLPPGTAATHNQALMELGAVLCTPRSPACPSCPFCPVCRAHAVGTPDAYPLTRKRRNLPHHSVALGIVFRGDEVFIDRRPYGGLLGGLWEFPGGKVEPGESAEEALHRELREEFGMKVRIVDRLSTVRHAYSHLRVTLHPYICRFVEMGDRVGEGSPWLWVEFQDLPNYPMPKANRKVLERLATWEAE